MERLTERYVPNDEKNGISGIKVFETENKISLVKVLSGEYLYPVILNIANALHTTTDYLLGSEAKGNEPYRMDQNIILKSIVYYGKEIQSTVCMEECAELIQAISKAKRGKPDTDNMMEEIADVLICIEILKQIYNIPDCSIENWIERKQERMLRRMEDRI